MYLYGGKNFERHNLVSIYYNGKWQRYQPKPGELAQGPKSPGRVSHSAVGWGKYMIIFGGEEEYKIKDNKRSCLNDIWFFDVTKMLWMDKTCGYRPS